jgi:hypothetical protein
MNGQARHPYAALYYPYATFGDERWLKESLLSWDRVALIRPTGVEASVAAAGPVERSILAHQHQHKGFVDPVTPDEESLERVYDAFWNSDQESLDQLQRRYGPEARDRLAAPARPTRQAAPAVADPRLIWVYAAERDSKMNYSMAELLLRRGLAVETHDREHQMWLGMHPQLASVYLTALTGELARTRGYVACTDDIAAHRAAGALDLDQIDRALSGRKARPGIAPTVQHVEARYLHIALQAGLRPVNLEQVPVEKLLDFRQQHRSEILAFRDHLSSIERQLAGMTRIADEHELARHLQDVYEARTREHVDNLRTAMNRSGIQTALRALTLKLDLAGAGATLPGFAAGAVATAIGAPVVAGLAPVAVALSAAPLITGFRQARREQRESPLAFLVVAERELGSDAALREALPR